MRSIFPILVILIVSCSVPEPVSTCADEVPSTKWTVLDQVQLQADIQSIDNYLDDNGIVAVKHPSGLRYVITEIGTGVNVPCLENVFSATYEGRLLSNNTIFDKNSRPAAFILGGLITGWQIAFLEFNRGTKATLYIPSGLGYGPNGRYSQSSIIPPNANLIFDVQLIDYR